MAQAEMLTPRQYAAKYKIHEESLRRWRKEGRGPKWVRLPGTKIIRYIDQAEGAKE